MTKMITKSLSLAVGSMLAATFVLAATRVGRHHERCILQRRGAEV